MIAGRSASASMREFFANHKIYKTRCSPWLADFEQKEAKEAKGSKGDKILRWLL